MKTTAAQQIEHTLARQIYRGERAAGETLPPLRALAADFGVTVPTVQRAIARLAATGLVTVRHGSGVTVVDPMATGDLRLMGDLLEASADQTERVAPLLADFLELRAVLAGHLIRTRSADLLAALPRVASAVQRLQDADTLADTALADAEVSRVFVEAAGNRVVHAVFHSVQRLAVRVPLIADAIYGDRGAHQAAMAAIVQALSEPAGDSELAAQGVQQALETWDAESVRRFRAGDG